MEDIITIKKLTFKYGDKKMFDNLSLSISDGSFLSIIGPNGSGKSTLIRLILGLYESNDCIEIFNKKMNKINAKAILQNIGVVFENPDNQFVGSTVKQDIAFSLENMNLDSKEINKKVLKIAKYLGIDDLLEREPHTLSGGQKQLASLASALVIEPKLLILDEAFTMVDNDTKDKIYMILQDVNKNKGVTIINVTHDSEEILYGDKVLLLHNGQIVDYGDVKDILSQEKKFVKMGLKLPFMADLSLKLKYYGLLDEVVLNMEEMVELLWK